MSKCMRSGISFDLEGEYNGFLYRRKLEEIIFIFDRRKRKALRI